MHISSMPAMSSALGRKLAVGVLAVAALLAAPTAATPARQIVVFGAHSGSTLTLSGNGRRIVVKGHMAHRAPLGCRFRHHHRVAVCPIRGAAGRGVDWAPPGPLAGVAAPLPIALTVHLGA